MVISSSREKPWFPFDEVGIFSGALLLSGLLGPLAGRMIDRYGGRDVLTVTSLMFAAGLALLAFASGTLSLAVAWGSCSALAWVSAFTKRPLPR